MTGPSFDEMQAPNLRAANEHLRRQAEQVPVLMQRIGELQAQLQRTEKDLELVQLECELKERMT